MGEPSSQDAAEDVRNSQSTRQVFVLANVLCPGPTIDDAAYFAKLGLESWGIDISETAVQAAKQVRISSMESTLYHSMQDLQANNTNFATFGNTQHIAKTPNPPTNVHFKVLDFFNFPLPEDGNKFVLAYDYTFLCALPPSLRDAWARRYAEIIGKDGMYWSPERAAGYRAELLSRRSTTSAHVPNRR